MGGGDGVAELREELGEIARRHGAARGERVRHGLPLEKLHGQPGHLRRPVDAGRHHRDDVIAGDPRRDAGLLLEARPESRVPHELGANDLERAVSARGELLCHEDGAHSTLTEGTENPKVLSEERASLQHTATNNIRLTRTLPA